MYKENQQTHHARFIIAAAAVIIAVIGWSAFHFASAGAQGSVTNGRIAFERTVNGISKIFTANASGGDEQCLMCADASDSRQGFEPAFSPNGQTIAFVRLNEIWLMNADGSNQRTLPTPSQGFSPGWSPDGTRLTFSRSSQFGFDIWIMNADGSNQIRLTTNEIDGPSVWGANNRIAFERTIFAGTTHDDIFVMDAADTNGDGVGDNLVNITNNPANDRAPAFSPDGARIAFHSDRGNPPRSDIYTMTVQGADVRLLTNPAYDDQDPVYSPDGTQIAFESGSRPETSANRIFLMNADGTNQRPLTAGTVQERNPSWQSGGGQATPTPTPPAASADLALTLTDAPDPAVEHQNVVYTATVTNNGPGNSQGNLRVTLLLENFVSLRGVFVTASVGCNDTGDGTIICQSDQNLMSGASIAFNVTVRYRPSRGTGTPDATATITRNGQTDPNSANNTASVETTIQAAPAPANDNFLNAQTLSTASNCVTGTNIGATIEDPFRGISGRDEPFHAGRIQGRSVWYKWTAPDYDGNVSFDTGGSGFNTILAVYRIRTDFPNANLTEIASNNDSFNRGTSYVYFRAERLKTYYIAVTGFDREAGPINLCWNVSRQVIPAPVPQRISALAPAFINVDPARGDLILQVTGSGFTTDSRVLVNSQECFRPNAAAPCETNTGIQTTFRSATLLEARIPAQFLRSAGALTINVLTGTSLSDATTLRILPLVVVTVPPQAAVSAGVTAPGGGLLTSTVTNTTTTQLNVTNAIYESSLLPLLPPPGETVGGTGFSLAPIISGGAGNIVSGGAGNLTATTPVVSAGAGNLIPPPADVLFLANSGGTPIVSNDGATIVSGGAGNLLSGGGGNFLRPGTQPAAGAGTTGWYVVRSAGGASPTVNVNQAGPDGEFTVSASFVFDTTSTPSAADLARTVFVVVTSASFHVTGQVTTPDGRGLRNAVVLITGPDGVTRSATTSSFGFYTFDDVGAGREYTLRINSRRYRFANRTLTVNNNVADFNFVGLE